MDKLFYLFLAYTFIWVLIFGYTLRLGRRQLHVQTELDILQKTIDRKGENRVRNDD
ncbi:MAG: CcmD family protein [Desulfitobacteriaceae bacterium]|nr:CcmD family protein [Desulfitobacteriaceae bacterium]MDI6913531.1 CcmD family protein [Desulfitobacteriaceae bacterium]